MNQKAGSGKTDQTESDLQSEIDSLKSDLASVQSDLRRIADSVVGEGRQRAREARDNVREQWDESVDTLHEYVREKPLTTILSAFGVGVLAGILMRRG